MPIATDLDGTLLCDELSVSPRTVAATRAAAAVGITVVPVTARQPMGIRTWAAEAGCHGWAMCRAGAGTPKGRGQLSGRP